MLLTSDMNEVLKKKETEIGELIELTSRVIFDVCSVVLAFITFCMIF